MRFECPDCQRRFTAIPSTSVLHALPACPRCGQHGNAIDTRARKAWKTVLHVLYLPVRLLHALYAPGSKRAEPEEPAAKAEGKAHTCELLGGIDADYDKTAATPRSVDHDRPGGYVCVHDGDGVAHTRVVPQGVDGEQVRHDLLKDIRSRVCKEPAGAQVSCTLPLMPW